MCSKYQKVVQWKYGPTFQNFLMQNINLEYVYQTQTQPAFRYSDMECVKLVKQRITFISEIGAYMICIVNFQNVLYIYFSFFLLSFDTFCISTNNKKQTHLYSKVGFKFIFYYKIHIFYLLQSKYNCKCDLHLHIIVHSSPAFLLCQQFSLEMGFRSIKMVKCTLNALF